MEKILNFWEKYYIHSILLSGLLFLFYLLWVNNSFLYSSILDYKNVKSSPFDWTVYPIEYVPDPFLLSYEERKKNYEQIDSKYFIKTPIYDSYIFWKDPDKLDSNSNELKETLTQRLIFTVPYIGTYNFDYKEYAGSHPWVDIIVPTWTPVRNIASWVIVDLWFQWFWFWNYILIRHDNILLDSWKTWSIYSLYAHLNSIDAKLWEKIWKWEKIWTVWDTWTATVPHLHFQLESGDAPFHPYWPFTTSQMKDAKVNFFDWVNTWLWKNEAIKYTLNPLKFVNDNLNNTIIVKKENEDILLTDNKIISNIVINEENLVKENESIEVKTKQEENLVKEEEKVNIEENLVKEEEIIQIWIKKEEILKQEVEILSMDKDFALKDNIELAMLSDTILANSNEINNEEWLKKIFENLDEENIIVNNNLSNSWVLDPVLEPIDLKEELLNWTQKDIKETKIFDDIKNDYKYFNELKYFKDNKIINGFLDNTFRPKNNITRIESLKIIFLSFWIKPILNKDSTFSDIKTNSWENTYINSWIDSRIISSNNNKFYPFRNISRVEGLKIILNLWKVDFTGLENDLTFIDVKNNNWHYKYVNYAIKNNLIEIKWNKFYPNKPLSREELVSILYKIILSTQK